MNSGSEIHCMKLILVSVTLAVCFGFAGCGGAGAVNALPAPNAESPTPAATPFVPKDGDYPARGKVTKINNEAGSIEIDHEEIVGVMPRMIMEFFVSDKAMLSGLKAGDQVNFVLRYKAHAETIIKIEKAK